MPIEAAEFCCWYCLCSSGGGNPLSGFHKQKETQNGTSVYNVLRIKPAPALQANCFYQPFIVCYSVWRQMLRTVDDLHCRSLTGLPPLK